ncbi:MAG: Hsp20/alpha crystallin family protein [Candidatus Aenigmatarchaeota archaeon]
MPFEDPFDELEKMQRRMNKLMKDFWERGPQMAGMVRRFPVDIVEEDEEVVVKADLPGVEKENVAVKAQDNKLMITAQEDREKKEESENYFRHERRRGKLQRTITLPENIESDKAKAEMEDGVLEVRFPKKKVKKKKEKEIEVE